MGIEAVSDLVVPTASLVSERDHVTIDLLERTLLDNFPVVDLPVTHRFTPGLYVRELFAPAGSLCTTKIHRTKHPFVMLKGRISVGIPGVGVEHMEAPKVGVTEPGTRRIVYVHEDTTWLTFHPLVDGESGLDDLAKIEERLIERRELSDGKTAFDEYSRLLDEMRARFLPGGDAP